MQQAAEQNVTVRTLEPFLFGFFIVTASLWGTPSKIISTNTNNKHLVRYGTAVVDYCITGRHSNH